jgi:hypothetical protein
MEGGCTCRQIRYRLTGTPLIVHACHRRWCQRETHARTPGQIDNRVRTRLNRLIRQLDGAVRMLSIKIETLIMNTQIRKPASVQAQGHPDVSRHSTRKINDLNPQLVAAIAEMPLPEGIDLLRHAR